MEPAAVVQRLQLGFGLWARPVHEDEPHAERRKVPYAALFKPKLMALLFAGTTERMCFAVIAIFLPAYLQLAYGTALGDRVPPRMPVRSHHRLARKEGSNRLRFLPLHLALEGYLALHFGGPSVLWAEWSERAVRSGLSPRAEEAYRGAEVRGLADALRVFEIHHGQCGVLVYVADALAAAFAVPHPEDYRALHPTLVHDLFGEFSACLADADSVVVAPLYSAGEPPIEGVSHATLAQGIRAAGSRSVVAVNSEHDIAPAVRRLARSGDIVICFGAGNSSEWAHALPEWLAGEPARAGGAL